MCHPPHIFLPPRIAAVAFLALTRAVRAELRGRTVLRAADRAARLGARHHERGGGARAYLKDLPDAEVHLLDTGHFALDEEDDFIAERIRGFLGTQVEAG
jgi:pimeloyl-ACP methyl ester carboxylesterase